MSLDLTVDKSTLVQVVAWCHQATSHYLSQCWPRFMSPYGVTRPQWVKFMSISFTLGWILPNDFDNKSTLVQVMVWCRLAKSYNLRQCLPRSMSPYGITKPQWVNLDMLNFSEEIFFPPHQHGSGSWNTSSWKTRTGQTYSQYHGCWCPGDARSQDISSHGIDLVIQKYSTFSTSRVKNNKENRTTQRATRRLENDNTPQPLDQWTNSPFIGQQVGNCKSFTLTHYLADLFAMHRGPRSIPLCI